MAALESWKVFRGEGGCYDAEGMGADEGVEGWEVPDGVVGSEVHSYSATVSNDRNVPKEFKKDMKNRNEENEGNEGLTPDFGDSLSAGPGNRLYTGSRYRHRDEEALVKFVYSKDTCLNASVFKVKKNKHTNTLNPSRLQTIRRQHLLRPMKQLTPEKLNVPSHIEARIKAVRLPCEQSQKARSVRRVT